MGRPYDDTCEKFKAELDALIATYQRPEEWRIGHGNLRHRYSTWETEQECCTNIAVIYETPGGSTTQLNYSFSHDTGEFTFLDSDLETQVVTTDPAEVMRNITDHIATIGEKRLAQVRAVIDSWLGEGKNRSQVIAELNKLLQAEFLGGRVNSGELKAGIQHVVARMRGSQR